MSCTRKHRKVARRTSQSWRTRYPKLAVLADAKVVLKRKLEVENQHKQEATKTKFRSSSGRDITEDVLEAIMRTGK